MADWHFERAQTWEDLLAAHEKWHRDYNYPKHQGHDDREDDGILLILLSFLNSGRKGIQICNIHMKKP